MSAGATNKVSGQGLSRQGRVAPVLGPKASPIECTAALQALYNTMMGATDSNSAGTILLQGADGQPHIVPGKPVVVKHSNQSRHNPHCLIFFYGMLSGQNYAAADVSLDVVAPEIQFDSQAALIKATNQLIAQVAVSEPSVVDAITAKIEGRPR